MSEFTHLHVHTELSPDGLGRISDLVERASKLGFEALAQTDHGTLAGTVQFDKKCKEHNIKPIIGVEGYLSIGNERFHITLLGDGDVGFRSLVNLQNEAHKNSDTADRRATFTVDELEKFNDGIILLTGCVASPFHKLMESDAIDLGKRLKRTFKERMFAEIMHVGEASDIWERSIKLAQELNLKMIATNDVHFNLQEYAPLQTLLTQIKSSYDYSNKELWLKSEKEMIDKGNFHRIDGFTEAVHNAYSLGKKLQSPQIKYPQKLPYIEDAYSKLAVMAMDGLIKIGKSLDPDYVRRLEYELHIIQRTNFSEYFIILKDIVDYSRLQGVRVGAGRGSGAGSLVLLTLGITSVDPIRYNLSFDRFLNPLRKGNPDVDMDFDPLGREIVMAYGTSKWGAIPVAAYQHLTQKLMVHRLGKVLGYDRDTEIAAADDCTGSEYKQLETDYPLFAKFVEVADGQTFGSSQHAAGMVIVPDELPIPVERMKNGGLAAAYSESSNGTEDLKYAGGTKYDFLSVDVLGMLRRLETRYKVEAPQPENTSEEDKKKMLALLNSGKVKGLFQFTTDAGNKLLSGLTENCTSDELFERMVIATTINRPSVPNELREKFKDLMKSPRYLHPSIDPIIINTGGVMIYQEQMMKVFGTITGGGDADGDLARRAILKYKVGENDEEIKRLEAKFMANKEISEETLTMLWEEIISSTRYGFNRSHSVAYMMAAWAQLWWALYYPIGFFAELMNMDSDNDEKVFGHVFQAAVNGIFVTPPDVNKSGLLYEHDDTRIYTPLTCVKGLQSGAQVVIDEREASGEFASISEFRERVPKRKVNSAVMKRLFSVGAFKGMKGKEIDAGMSAIETQENNIKSQFVKEIEIMGFVIPTPTLLEFIKRESKGWTGGLIYSKEIKDKGNGRGEYAVFRFLPNDVCAARPIPAYNVGDIVFFKKSGYGISNTYRSVRFHG